MRLSLTQQGASHVVDLRLISALPKHRADDGQQILPPHQVVPVAVIDTEQQPRTLLLAPHVRQCLRQNRKTR